MKKMLTILSVFFVISFFTGCNANNEPEGNSNNEVIENNNIAENNGDNEEDKVDNNENVENESGSNTSEAADDFTEAKNQDDMKEMMDQLNFTEIEIEISYGKDKEYEVEIEHHSNGDIEAEVEDEINGIDIDDDLEAFNHLYPLVKQLNVNQGSDKQDVINQVLNIFNLDSDYEKFEVEITFEDGVEIEFEDRK